MPQQLEFVLTDGSGKIQPTERQAIRRHCMQKKNKQLNSRRSKREAARITAGYASTRPDQDQIPFPRSRRRSDQDESAVCSELNTRGVKRQISCQPCLVTPPPSDWALFHFPDELNVASQNLMHRYFVYNPIRDMQYPFKHFGIHFDFHEDPSWCFRLFCSEKLYFNAILLLSSASNDFILRQPLSPTTYRYLRRTLPALNDRLSDRAAYQHDAVLYLVGVLASIAILFGDYNAAKSHAMGLSEIIRLRGGFGAFNHNPVIQFSIDRLNFSSALVTELWTPIYGSSTWKEPVFSAEVTRLHYSQNMISIDTWIEPELELVFRNLQYTTILLNTHHCRKTPVDGSVVRQCLGFLHSSLIETRARPQTKFSRCLHLGMMVFLATTFRLPDLHEYRFCRSLAYQLQLAYADMRTTAPDLPQALHLWLFLMILISADERGKIDPRAQWGLTADRDLTWSEARRHLKQVMWIDCFHEDPGKRALASSMALLA